MSAQKAHLKKTENIICELKKIQALLRSTCMKCAAESPSSYFTVGEAYGRLSVLIERIESGAG